MEKLIKKKEKLIERKAYLMDKMKKLGDEVEKVNSQIDSIDKEMATKKLHRLDKVLEENNLKLEDVITALKNGDLESLESKILEASCKEECKENI